MHHATHDPTTAAAPSVVAAYLTFPDEATAVEVARALLEARVAACVNVLPAGTSVYRWQGEARADAEVVAVAKTTSDRLDALRDVLLRHHPYELPCLVAYPAVGGLDAYLAWVHDETRPA